MKKPIIKAHANGWLPNDRTDCIDIHNIHIEKDLFYFNARLKINDYNDAPMFEDSEMNLYKLIFGTDFIDKLVGDGCIQKVPHAEDCESCRNGKLSEHDYKYTCTRYDTKGDYYRRMLVNRSLEDIKQLIRELTQKGYI
jgi:hypothetical protein